MIACPPRNQRETDIGSTRKRLEILGSKTFNRHFIGASEEHFLNIPKTHEILERNR